MFYIENLIIYDIKKRIFKMSFYYISDKRKHIFYSDNKKQYVVAF